MLVLNIISWAAAVLFYIAHGRDYYKKTLTENLRQRK